MFDWYNSLCAMPYQTVETMMPSRKYNAGFSSVLTIAALCAIPATALAQTTPKAPPVTATAPAAVTKPILQDADKEKDIRQLITLTGGDKMGEQVMDQLMPAMQKMAPDAPPTFWLAFRNKTRASDLVDLIIPIYDKYYSRDDVRGLIQFYQTPLGQKVISAAPDITRESYAVGSAWGEKKAQEVIRDLQAREAAQPAKKAPTAAKPAKAPAAKPHKAVAH